MKSLKMSLCSLLLVPLAAQAATLTGWWSFDTGNPLEPRFSNGVAARLIPAGTPSDDTNLHYQGINYAVDGIGPGDGAQRVELRSHFQTHHGLPATGANQPYTLVMDVKTPAASMGAWRTLYQMDTANINDAAVFLNRSNGIGGSSSPRFGSYSNFGCTADAWYRIVIACNTTTQSVWVNGVKTNTRNAALGGSALDVRGAFFLLLGDDSAEDAALDITNLYVYDGVLTDTEITTEHAAPIGTDSATGLAVDPFPAVGIDPEAVYAVTAETAIDLGGTWSNGIGMSDPAAAGLTYIATNMVVRTKGSGNFTSQAAGLVITNSTLRLFYNSGESGSHDIPGLAFYNSTILQDNHKTLITFTSPIESHGTLKIQRGNQAWTPRITFAETAPLSGEGTVYFTSAGGAWQFENYAPGNYVGDLVCAANSSGTSTFTLAAPLGSIDYKIVNSGTGTWKINASEGALAGCRSFTINRSTGILNINGDNTLTNLVVESGTVGGTAALTFDIAEGEQRLKGTQTDTWTLIKTGQGTLAFAMGGTRTGATRIEGGTLSLETDFTADATWIVGSEAGTPARLTGTGSVSGEGSLVQVKSGGIIESGLTVANLVLDDGAILKIIEDGTPITTTTLTAASGSTVEVDISAINLDDYPYDYETGFLLTLATWAYESPAPAAKFVLSEGVPPRLYVKTTPTSLRLCRQNGLKIKLY